MRSLFLALLVGSAAFAGGPEPVSEKSVLARNSLERLDSAATVLVRAADGGGVCSISSVEARSLILPLHALIDRKIEAFLRLRASRRDLAPAAWAKECARDCHCGGYASLLEKASASGRALSASDQKTLAALSARASALTPAERDGCVSRAKWFCGSELLRYLRQEAPVSTPEG